MSDMSIKSVAARVALVDPSTPTQRLSKIAANHPELGAAVAAHPNADPELLGWLEQHGDALVQLMVVQRRASDEATLTSEPERPADPEAESLDVAPLAPAAAGPVRPTNAPRVARGRLMLGAVLFTGVVGLLLLALLAWHWWPRPAFTPNGTPTAVASGPAWSSPALTGVPAVASGGQAAPAVTISGIGDVVLAIWSDMGNPWSGHIAAFDATSLTQLWSQQAVNTAYTAFVDTGSLVFQAGPTLQVVDPRSGKVLNQTTLGAGEFGVDSGPGVVVTERSGTNKLCARALSDITKCAWTTDETVAAPSDAALVFGGGAWVNTAKGVVDATSGSPAAFGADAQGASGSVVTYFGPSKDRVIRESTDSATGLAYQLWSGATNQGLGSVFQADGLAYDATSGVVVAGQALSQSSQLTALSWTSGETSWKVTLPFGSVGGWTGTANCIVGQYFLASASNGANSMAAAVSLTSGQITWSQAGYLPVGAVQSGAATTAYMQQGSQLVAFDAASPAFTKLWAVNLPEWNASVRVIGDRVYAQSADSGRLWVLNAG